MDFPNSAAHRYDNQRLLLFMIGDGPMRKQLVRMAAELGIADHVRSLVSGLPGVATATGEVPRLLQDAEECVVVEGGLALTGWLSRKVGGGREARERKAGY